MKNIPGGKVSIVNGGPLHMYVHLRFLTKKKFGINFTVNIYGVNL